MKLQLAYAKSDEKVALLVYSSLRSFSYEVNTIKEDLLSTKDVILALFTSSTTKEEFLSSLPWLDQQIAFSSLPHLKVMPFFVYHSSKEDPEEVFEGETGQLYEDIFSGEFKPFGWDLDSSCPEREFPRVLEEYSE